jgi:hypothetical protein
MTGTDGSTAGNETQVSVTDAYPTANDAWT